MEKSSVLLSKQDENDSGGKGTRRKNVKSDRRQKIAKILSLETQI